VHATRLLIVPAAAALGLFAEWAALRPAPFQPPAGASDLALAAVDLATGLALMGGGAVAWDRRPDSLTGPLLAVAGVAWFLGTFAASGNSTLADFGAVFVTLHRGPLVHALLSYPHGRVERLRERAAIALAYVLAAVPDLGETTAATVLLAGVVFAVAAARAREATGPLRRARVVAAAGAAAFSGVLLASALARLGEAGPSTERGVLWAYDIVVGAVAIGLAVDLVLGRWVSATVTGLVVDLGDVAKAGPLRDRLASALGDPSLVVAYRVRDRDVYVDDAGSEVDLAAVDAERRVTVVGDEDEPVAVLVHDAAVAADPELMRSVAAAAQIAVGNALLQAEVRRQLEDLEASRRRLVEAGDAERGRLEQQLRDGAEQRLVRVAELLDAAARRAPSDGTIAELQARLDVARSELGAFARGVHPRMLLDGGLRAALEELAAASRLPIRVTAPGRRFEPSVEAAAYFVCSEAVANVAKHAAASGATIDVVARDGTLVIAVVDDGRGGATLDGGSGLRGLADRVEAVGGRLTVTSAAQQGTRLVAELPLA
jgi:signal transduction histidine kinase